MTERPSEAEIGLSYQDGRTAMAICDAVRPDNDLLPPGLEIRTELRGLSVKFRLICHKSLESLWETLDDLLACIQAAEKALGAVKRA